MGFLKSPEPAGAIPLRHWPELKSEYVELARFWISDKRSLVLVSPNDIASPALLGSLIVESIHSAADAFAARDAISKSEALAQLWQGFDEERARLAAEEGNIH